MIELEHNGIRYEVDASADAGINLSDSSKWWGTRIRYRRMNIADKRWHKFLVIDLHPFDFENVKHAVSAYMDRA